MTWSSYGFRFIVAFVGIALTCTAARANDIYITQNQSGAHTGQTCADAYAYTFFNNSANWGAGLNQIGPGTIVHLCGTFTAAAGSSGYLVFQGSGLAGSPVTLHFESGAFLESAYWGAAGAINSNGKSYIIVDGGSNGLVQATDNGSAMRNQQDGKGVYLASCNNCEVRNLTISNIYVHSSVSDESGLNTYGVYVQGGNNVTLDNNTVHDVKWALEYGFPGGTISTNVQIFNNLTYHCDHGISVGSGNTGAVLSGALLFGNTSRDHLNWEDTNNLNHHDGIHVWAVHASSSITGLQIYNNRIYGDWGIHCTANIFVDVENGGATDRFYIFNNDLGATNAGSHTCGNGFIAVMGTNGHIVNNTMVSDSNVNITGIDNYGSGQTILNNVFHNVRTGIYSPAGTSVDKSDYNSFYGPTNNAMSYQGTWYASFSAWQTATGFDTHSVTTNPNLSSTDRPLPASPLIGTGADLSALGLAALSFDMTGVARTPPWTIGAFAYIGVVVNPPSGLTATPR